MTDAWGRNPKSTVAIMDSSSKRKQGSRRPALLAEGLEERRLLSGRALDFKFVNHGRAADVGTTASSQSHSNVTQAIAQRAALRFAAAAKAELSRMALLATKHLAGHAPATMPTASPNMPVSPTSTSAPVTSPPSSPTAPPTTTTTAGAISTTSTPAASASPVAAAIPVPILPPSTTAVPVVATPVNPGGPMMPVTSTPAILTPPPVQGNTATFQLWTDEQAIQAKSQATPAMATAIANDIQALSSQIRTVPGQSQLQALGSELTATGVTPATAQLSTLQTDYKAMLTSMGITNTALITQTFNDIETYVSAAGVTAADLATLAADLKAAGLPPGTTMPGTLSCTLPALLTPTVTTQGQVQFLVPPTNMPTTVTVWTATS
jgi:hypothetical protein